MLIKTIGTLTLSGTKKVGEYLAYWQEKKKTVVAVHHFNHFIDIKTDDNGYHHDHMGTIGYMYNANCYYYMVHKLFPSHIPLRVSGSSSSLGNKEGRILSLSRPIPLRDYINSVQRENRLLDDLWEIFIIILSLAKQRYFYRLLLAPNPAVQRNTNHMMALRCNALHCIALYYIFCIGCIESCALFLLLQIELKRLSWQKFSKKSKDEIKDGRKKLKNNKIYFSLINFNLLFG